MFKMVARLWSYSMDAMRDRYRVLSYLLTVGLVAAVYFGAAKLGLALSAVHGSVSLLWPPTGLALAIILLWGQRFWLGIMLGAFLAHLLTNGSLPFAIIAGLVSTLESLAVP